MIKKIPFIFYVRRVLLLLLFVVFLQGVFAQEQPVDLTIDVNSPTFPLPRIFRPNIDLSGRGMSPQHSWPQGVASPETIDLWQKDIGFGGIYRIQYNIWEVYELSKYRETQQALLQNYEDIIRRINEAGGIVLLDIFGMPAGLGKVLDRRSSPFDPKAFKELIKGVIRNFSCEKRYNIWYELWTSPDSEDFFLGRRQEYLNLYRMVAEAVQDLEKETKIQIPLGGPGVSFWFQNVDGNTILSPERSLIYELIKFCYHYRLPLDFISWHAYSSDPKVDQDITIYRKSAASLIREWLSYFHFNYNLPLIISEWNFDLGPNIIAERYKKSYVAASYIPARLKNMYEAGLDHSVFYCLEDFRDNKEGVARNVGVFALEPTDKGYQAVPKAMYSVFKMLGQLGNRLYPSSLKLGDEFIAIIATKDKDGVYIIISNYIDPNIGINFISRNLSTLSDGERKILLGLVKYNKLERLLQRKIEMSSLRLTRRLKALVKKALDLQERAQRLITENRIVNLAIKNLNDNYSYQRFVVDSSCGLNCQWLAKEEKDIDTTNYQQALAIAPYSVHFIVLERKPKEGVATSLSIPAEDTVVQAEAKDKEKASSALPQQ